MRLSESFFESGIGLVVVGGGYFQSWMEPLSLERAA